MHILRSPAKPLYTTGNIQALSGAWNQMGPGTCRLAFISQAFVFLLPKKKIFFNLQAKKKFNNDKAFSYQPISCSMHRPRPAFLSRLFNSVYRSVSAPTRTSFLPRSPAFISPHTHIIMAQKRSYESSSDKAPQFLPPINRTMRTLDKSFFKTEVPLVVIKLGNPAFISKFARQFQKYILQQPGVGHVVYLNDKTQGGLVNSSSENASADKKPEKGILLSQQYSDPEQAQRELSPVFKEILDQTTIDFMPYTLRLGYDYWKSEEILAAVLPEELLNEIPCGFTIVGHVAHLNIRDQYLPYKAMIGQVVLDKNPKIRTVVNKLDAIDTVFRTFAMEVLAGDHDFMVEQSESNCRFRFDFSKVYWNSRLHTEHDRLISKFQKGEAVCDVFAGVGPFAVPAGKKEALVFANDLNPESHKYLVDNIKLNKVETFVKPFCRDGRTFIYDAVTELVNFAEQNPTLTPPRKGRGSRSNPPPQPEPITVPKYYSHYVMNLPDSATDFLDSYIGLYSDPALRTRVFGSDKPEDVKLPQIHVHCFHKHEPHQPEPTEEVVFENLRQRVSGKLNHEMALDQLYIHNVRKVAPTKTMHCISFTLPLEVALAAKN